MTVALGATATSSSARAAADSILGPAATSAGRFLGLQASEAPPPGGSTFAHDLHFDDRLIVEALRRSTVSRRGLQSSQRRTTALPTSVGSSANLWVLQAAIGSSSVTFAAIPATLLTDSGHGYIWVDNTLSFSASDLRQIAIDFENAYNSDTVHFGTSEYDQTAPAASVAAPPCDSNGMQIVGAPPAAILIPPPNLHHVVFVVNQHNLGSGVGGYFGSANHFTQGFVNCVNPQLKSNEASMIVVGYNTQAPATVELNEDLVRGTAHEFQHLINFVNHSVLPQAPVTEDLWINEGLSMLSQDFAVSRQFSVPFDIDARNHASDFMSTPDRFSLTGFSGIEPGPGFSFNCPGCYGASYLFMRYLYERFGGDTFSMAMESGSSVSFAKLQAATQQPAVSLLSDFGVALMASGTGLTTDPRFTFRTFNPYGSFTDQFGGQHQLNGVGGNIQTFGTTTNYTPFNGTFKYLFVTNGAQGASVRIANPAGVLQLAPALLQR